MERTPALSVTVVAAEIRRRRPRIGKTKLHKLLYYVQGYHLAWEGAPAFRENIEAWEKGPVVASLWRAERRRHYVESTDRPPESVCNVVTYVLRRLGDKSGRQLIDATHAETPWKTARRVGGSRTDEVISRQSLIDFFSSESPDLQRIREAVAAEHDGSPFVPDPPGLREELIADYRSK